jgi:hypothetical protein
MTLASACAGNGRDPAPEDIAATINDQQLRCVDEPITGSRVPQRVCRTLAEWKELEKSGKAIGRDVQGPVYGTRDPGPVL